MNYYYDIILNWNEEENFNFYEWNDTDYLELVKKIPFFRVKHKTLVDLISNKVRVDKEFLDLIKDKTLISSKCSIKRISAALFTDGKNVYALEFNDEGLSINKSSLLVDDDLNALEATYGIKEYLLNYENIEELSINKTLRQVEDAKRLIALEVNNLYQNKDLAKLKYLYYEYKKEKILDIDVIYHNIITDLEGNFNKDILNLYYIIRKSYHNV